MSKTISCLTFAVGGAVLGAALWGVAWVVAANGHGSGVAYTIFFPWSEALYRARLFGDGTRTWSFLVAWFQMPVYALVVSLFPQGRGRAIAAIVLLTLHLVAIAACL